MIPGITEGCVGAWGVVRSLVPEGCVAAGAILIWVAMMMFRPQAAAKGHALVLGPVADGVCGHVHDPCPWLC